MVPLIVWTDAALTEQGATADFTLDLEVDVTAGQDGANDFALTLPMSVAIAANSAVYLEGSPFGGLVQQRASDTAVDGVLEWRGRSWHGVLADRVLVPDPGQAYNTASGTAAECVADLVSRLGLAQLFGVGECEDATVSYQYPRYPDGMTALYGMLASAGLRPTFTPTRTGGVLKVLVGAVESSTVVNEVDGAVADVAILADFTPYNHIIALGQGELADREVIHRYADASGSVSSTQSLTGLAERVYVYDYPSAESDELAESAEAKLAEFQGEGSVSVELADGADMGLGDYVYAYDHRIGESVTARVTGCVVKVKDGTETRAWSAGE